LFVENLLHLFCTTFTFKRREKAERAQLNLTQEEKKMQFGRKAFEEKTRFFTFKSRQKIMGVFILDK